MNLQKLRSFFHLIPIPFPSMKKLWQLLPLLGLLLGGCAQQQEADTSAAAEAPEIVVPPPASMPAGPLASLWQTNRPVIYQGTMNLLVSDFATTTHQLDTLLHRYGAYLAQAHEDAEDGRHTQQLTIRVPSARFMPLTFALGELGYVENKDISSRDLTSAQLRVRIQDTTASVLSAHDKLLADEATMGTLTLQYYQLIPAAMAPQPPLAPRLTAGLRFGWHLLGEILVACTYFWPLSLLLIGWLVYRYSRRPTTH